MCGIICRPHVACPDGGTDLFVYHGYSELRLNDRWVKATPAFNAELCARFGVPPIDFDGHSDALLHAHDGEGSKHMEYLNDRGWYHDLPFTDIVTELHNRYGPLMQSPPRARRLFAVRVYDEIAIHRNTVSAIWSTIGALASTRMAGAATNVSPW